MPQLSGGLGTAASICVMIVVIGCFSVLWSFIYYPMLKSWRGNEPDHTVEERMLPPKVREAMRMSHGSSVHHSAQPPKRPVGRPPFHMEHDRHAKREITSQGSSVMNLFMPVYTVVVVIFFLFIMTRIGWRKMATSEEEEEAAESNARQIPQCNCNMQHYPRKPGVFQKNRESLVNTATYRALSHLGDGDPSKSLTSFLNDMETFKSHIAFAGEMKRKLEKLEQVRLQKLADEATNKEAKEKDESNADEESRLSTDETKDDSNKPQETTEQENAQTDVEETQIKDVLDGEKETEPMIEEKLKEEPKCSMKSKARRRKHRKATNVSNTENVPPLKEGNGKRNKRKAQQNENLKME